MDNYEAAIKNLLKETSIEINGKKSFDPIIHNTKVYSRILRDGTLGVGESYMEGWWDCKKLDQFFFKTLSLDLKDKLFSYKLLFLILKSKIFNYQNIKNSNKVIAKHYDLSNDLYFSFLDSYKQYTCGYWRNTNSLDKAQEQKLDLICKKLKLKKSDKVLEFGCGWGGFAKFAAEKYGCQVTGVNISNEQVKYAKRFTKNLPVKIIKQDYRNFNSSDKYDKIVAIGLMEHIGPKNYRDLIKISYKYLKDDGLLLLHTIGNNKSVRVIDPWIDKYIFPGAVLPSIKQLGKAFEKLFVMEDWQNFGPDYDKTLMAWNKNFNENYKKLDNQKFDLKFKRMFNFYFLSCAGLFRARKAQLWQIVLSKKRYKKYDRVS